jgi:hypothetical protein
VQLDDSQLHLEPGQIVIPHGADRYLEADEVILGKLRWHSGAEE